MKYDKILEVLHAHLINNKLTENCKRRPYFRFIIGKKELEVSIQASEYHYCTPRDNHTDFYEEVELGFPNFLFSEDFIARYAEDIETPKDTVYPYVPLEELAKQLWVMSGDKTISTYDMVHVAGALGYKWEFNLVKEDEE